jgi:hypothetical protein
MYNFLVYGLVKIIYVRFIRTRYGKLQIAIFQIHHSTGRGEYFSASTCLDAVYTLSGPT